MKRGYVPNADVEFMDWMSRFVKSLEPLVSELDLDVEDFEDLKSLNADFRAALVDHVRKQDESRDACAFKNDCRKQLEAEVRRLVRQADGHPSMSDSVRADLGLDPRQETGREAPVLRVESVPESKPIKRAA